MNGGDFYVLVSGSFDCEMHVYMVFFADVGAVMRNGLNEMVLVLLLCCGGNARVLMALVVWVLLRVTRVAVVRA